MGSTACGLFTITMPPNYVCNMPSAHVTLLCRMALFRGAYGGQSLGPRSDGCMKEWFSYLLASSADAELLSHAGAALNWAQTHAKAKSQSESKPKESANWFQEFPEKAFALDRIRHSKSVQSLPVLPATGHPCQSLQRMPPKTSRAPHQSLDSERVLLQPVSKVQLCVQLSYICWGISHLSLHLGKTPISQRILCEKPRCNEAVVFCCKLWSYFPLLIEFCGLFCLFIKR